MSSTSRVAGRRRLSEIRRRARSGRLGDLILACLDPDPARPSVRVQELAAGMLPAGLSAAAQAHGVAGFVRNALVGLGEHRPCATGGTTDTGRRGDPERTGLEEAWRSGLHQHLRMMSVLGRVAEALNGLGSPWAVLKGPVLAATAYPRPDLRSYTDLDVLVAPGAVKDSTAALQRDLGVRPAAFNRPEHDAAGEAEVPLALFGHGDIDLHWHVLNRPDLRACFRMPTDELLARARTVDAGGVWVPTLDAADTLVHLALHGAVSGAHRLVWLTDLRAASPTCRRDWDEVMVRARDARAEAPLALMLRRTERLLGQPVPGDVLRALAPGGSWASLAAIAERMATPARLASTRHTGQALFMAARGSGAASTVALVRNVLGRSDGRAAPTRRAKARSAPGERGWRGP